MTADLVDAKAFFDEFPYKLTDLYGRVRVADDRVLVRLHIVARPGQVLEPLAAQVRTAVAATVERLLGLDLGTVTVIVDGVGG